MSAPGAPNHNKRLSSETEHSQRVSDMEAVQKQLKQKERQRFFEHDVLQHDVDIYLSTAHLHIDNKKLPVGSISSMEVNVDMLEQMDLMDISDHEALDVFLNSANDTSALVSPLADDHEDGLEKDEDKELSGQECCRGSRFSSTSSSSTEPCSPGFSEGGAETPVIQADEEEVQVDNFLLMSTASEKEEDGDLEDDSEGQLGQLL